MKKEVVDICDMRVADKFHMERGSDTSFAAIRRVGSATCYSGRCTNNPTNLQMEQR
jgi:hypothetical protein